MIAHIEQADKAEMRAAIKCVVTANYVTMNTAADGAVELFIAPAMMYYKEPLLTLTLTLTLILTLYHDGRNVLQGTSAYCYHIAPATILRLGCSDTFDSSHCHPTPLIAIRHRRLISPPSRYSCHSDLILILP